MKWLILLILFLILMALIVVRFRRQINTGIEIFKMFRQLRNQTKPREKKLAKKAANESVPLVRCANAEPGLLNRLL